MAERLRSVMDLLKLADVCHRCSAIFGVTNERLHDSRFEKFSEKLRITLDRFAFELQTETRRIGDAELQPQAFPVTDDPTLLRGQAENELEVALRRYDALLVSGLPTHARAMVQRQRQTLSEMLRDLGDLRGRKAS